MRRYAKKPEAICKKNIEAMCKKPEAICKAKESAEDLLPLGTQQEKDLPGKCQLVNGHEYYHHPGGP